FGGLGEVNPGWPADLVKSLDRSFRFSDWHRGRFMRKPLGICAVVLGAVGVLLCAAALGVGWWAAARTADRIGGVTARLDRGLSEADVRLGRVEARVNTVRSDLN